ncbi:WhiB family transcriptional regulator [Luteipulveratus halotolerans]|uniref:WhiB family transcriptional regulator n=1 Tax=Luteipulveratus halotolerans TaxID=1631356 RepID=UPI000A423946|nr:WhiB family transcriptional regulator [Luteipulveratus halotolerans]
MRNDNRCTTTRRATRLVHLINETLLAHDDGDTLPCRTHDPAIWFAESPVQVERAKTLCRVCPFQAQCLADAQERQEPWGVWGGEFLVDGEILVKKRARGRPRKKLDAA